MSGKNAKTLIEEWLEKADVKINGDRPWDIQVNDERFYKRVLSGGSLALGESYMDAWWYAVQVEEFIARCLRVKLENKFKFNSSNVRLFLESLLVNMQSYSRSRKVIRDHYDIDNELFMSFLDPFNQYTCGYYKDTEDLNEAQEKKLDLICRKLHLKPTDKVLDIGCGWGGFSKFAAENYGCHVTGISISDEQLKYAKAFCKGLPVNLLKLDYRNLPENNQFDKVLVCGMIEHVGQKNYGTLISKVNKCLKTEGLFLLHTIGSSISVNSTEPWLGKYIFPNSVIPSLRQISNATEELFVTEDLHNFGHHYYKTLKGWYENFNRNWSSLQHKYDDRFFRIWEFYFLFCAGSFLARKNQLWQFVFSKNGQKGGYSSKR